MKVNIRSKQKLTKKPQASPKQLTAAKKPDKIKKSIKSPQIKKLHKSFFEDEQSFKHLFESMSSCVAIYTASANGKDFVFKDFNKSAEKAEKIDRKKIIGKSVLKVFPGVKNLGLFKVFQRVWKTGKPEYHPTAFYKDTRIQGWKENYVYKLPTGEIVAIYDDVTERKRAEETLSQKTALLEAQLNSSIEGILVVDSQGEKILQNQRTIDLWKIPQHVADNDDDQIQVQHVMKMTKNPEQFVKKVVYLYDHPNETSRDEVELTDGTVLDRYSAPVLGKDGYNYGRIWTFRDITERKRLEDILVKERGELKLIIDSSPIIVFYKDREGKFIRVNKIYAELLNMPAENFVGKTVFDFYSPQIAQSMTDDDQVVFQSRRPKLSIIEQYESASGIRWVQTDKIPTLDKDGIPIGLIGFSQDITERKRVEEALRESEENFRRSLDDSPLGVRIVTAEGETLYANQAVLDIYGYESIEELRKTPLKQRYTPESYADFQIRKEKRARGEFSPSEYEINIVTKNDEIRHIQVFRKEVIWNGTKQFQIICQDITEHKQAEEALQKSEEKYRTILKNIEDGYYEVDFKGNFTFFNDSMCRTLGYPQEEMMGMNNRQFTDKENAKKLFQTFNEVYKTGKPAKGFDWHIIRKDGTKRYIEVSVSLQKDSSGKPIGFQGISRDITERKLADEKLRQSEEKYRSILENITEGYFENDLRGNFTFFNDSLPKTYGYSRDELLRMNYRQIMDEENAAKVYEAYNRVYTTGKPNREIQFEVIRKDGTRRYLENSVSLINDAQGKPIGFRGISRDIAERKRIENELRQSEEKYRTILEDMEDGYYETDLAGNFTFFNDSLCRIFGYPRKELMGINNKQYTDEENAKKVFKFFNAIYRTGESGKIFDNEIIRKDGTKRQIEVSGSLKKDSLGNPTGFRGIIRDITERKRAEEVLRESEEKYRTIIETMQDGCFETDLAGNFTFVNDAQCKITGTPREQLLGKNNRDYSSEEEAKRLYQIYSRIYRTGEPEKGYAFEFTRRDGTKAFHEVSASLIRDARGKPIGFRGVSRDVTERKQMEETLRQSEERYRTIIETMEDGYWETDLPGNFTFVNDAECKIAGTPKEQLIGRNNQQYTDKTTAKRLYEAFKEIYKTGEPVKSCDFEFIRRDGTRLFAEFSASLIRDAQGKPTGFRGVTRDVTERKRAEETLAKSEEKYRSLVENAQEGIYQSTVRYLTLNPAFARMLGYDSPEEVMATITDIAQQLYVNPDDRKKLLEMVNEKESVTDFETKYYKKDGSHIWVSINMHAVRDDQGRILYYQGINQDITEKKKIEAERQENIERLRKSLGATINAMAVTVETRDPYTAGHQRRVADLARAIATELNLGRELIDGVRMASMIHDIGKISIPSEILTKPTQLSALEFNLIKIHSESGYNILKDIEFPWPIARIVLEHHEKINGSGYPQGLKGDQILIESRILCVADVVEAISSHRPYRAAQGLDVAFDEITKNKGILYDADVADACLRLFREKNYKMAA